MKKTKNQQLTRGFTALNGTEAFQLSTEVFELGFYIHTYHMKPDEPTEINQTARAHLSTALLLIDKYRTHYTQKGWTTTEAKGKPHKVVFDNKTQKYTISL